MMSKEEKEKINKRMLKLQKSIIKTRGRIIDLENDIEQLQRIELLQHSMHQSIGSEIV